MRIYMQTPPSGDANQKFCHLILQEDLLTGWSLVRESGSQGRAGRITKRHYESRDEAAMALEKARDDQVKKGFRVVFAQGFAG